MYIILFLIVFFAFLIIYQLILAHYSLKEGLENSDQYQPYNDNNATMISQQNAANIEVLKKRIDDLNGIKQTIDNLTQNVNKLNVQVDQLSQQQANYAQSLVGDTPPSISGTNV
jgi:uncharacterized protein YoxC